MKKSLKPQVVAVVGPTASGKTALSVYLAKLFGGEVVSADSMQIYKDMNIATAKPSLSEMQGIKHHLMDFLDAEEIFSVASYVDLAHKSISDICSRGKLPVIAGGTGLYVDNLLSGTVFSEGETDFGLREELMKRAEEEGIDALLQEIKEYDSESYEKLRIERNPKRIVRAIEIYKTTGVTMSRQNELSKPEEEPYEAVRIGIDFKDRQALYNRINLRVDMMIEQGLLKEAEEFFSSHIGNTANQAIGYKELKPYFNGEDTLENCIESLKRATRRYAKRQLTWFRRNADTNWFYFDDYSSAEDFKSAVSDFLISKGFDLV